MARRIRASRGDDRPVLIAVSGWGQEHDRERSASAGFDQHLTKPVDPEVMLRLVREATAARRPSRPV